MNQRSSERRSSRTSALVPSRTSRISLTSFSPVTSDASRAGQKPFVQSNRRPDSSTLTRRAAKRTARFGCSPHWSQTNLLTARLAVHANVRTSGTSSLLQIRSKLWTLPRRRAGPAPVETRDVGVSSRLEAHRDRLSKIRHPCDFCGDHELAVGQGFELRSARVGTPTDPVPDLEGKFEVDTKPLKKLGRIFEFPSDCLKEIPKERCFIRKRGGNSALSCPTLLISSSIATKIRGLHRSVSRRTTASDWDFRQRVPEGLAQSPFALSRLRFRNLSPVLAQPRVGNLDIHLDAQDIAAAPSPLGQLSPMKNYRSWASLHGELSSKRPTTSR